jgi:hypothetical protein
MISGLRLRRSVTRIAMQAGTIVAHTPVTIHESNSPRSDSSTRSSPSEIALLPAGKGNERDLKASVYV